MAHAAPATGGFSAWLNRPAETTELELARAEREVSERRLEAVRQNIIGPILKKGTKNQFSEHLRTLLEGR